MEQNTLYGFLVNIDILPHKYNTFTAIKNFKNDVYEIKNEKIKN